MNTAHDQIAPDLLLAIGSNIEPERNIRRAIKLLREKVHVQSVSTFYWSEAVGGPAQPRFINGACRVATDLAPGDLKFGVLRDIERQLGRVRSANKYAPREIDIDIAMQGDKTISEPQLIVPDPTIGKRAFLAVPLAELAPDWIVPGIGARLCDIAESMNGASLEPAVELTNELKKEFLP